MRGKVKNYLRKACDFFAGTYLLTAAAPRVLFSDCDFTDRTDRGALADGHPFYPFHPCSYTLARQISWTADFADRAKNFAESTWTCSKGVWAFPKATPPFPESTRPSRHAREARVSRARNGRTAGAERACRARDAMADSDLETAVCLCRADKPCSGGCEWTAHSPPRQAAGTAGEASVYKRRWAVRQIASTNLQTASRSALSSSRNFSTLRRASLRVKGQGTGH